MNEHFLLPLVALLTLSVGMVTLFRALNWPPIIGYIFMGILLGTHGLDLIPVDHTVQFIAEFGVVFLLFAIGLEFSLPTLWSMRKIVLGIGGMQVLITSILIAGLLVLLNIDWIMALVLGGALTLSSTAVVSKQLREQAELQSRHGQTAIGVLIFEDIAAIPLLIIIAVLAQGNVENLGWDLGWALIKGAIAIGVLLWVGHYLMRPLFHIVARTQSSELFTLSVLLVAIGAGAVTHELGLSMALGAFAAGMMLADTEYKHQVESDIRPFQDLFLAFFFVTVGLLINPQVIADNWLTVAGLVLALVVIKGVSLYYLIRIFAKPKGVAMRSAFIMAHAGEFGFALISLAINQSLIDSVIGQVILTAAILSMMTAPFVIKHNGRWVKRLLGARYTKNLDQAKQDIKQATQSLEQHVILCGYGRVGQTVGKFLAKRKEPYIALDIDIGRIGQAQAANKPVYFGDSSRREILAAARLENAKMVMVCFADHHQSLKVVDRIRQVSKTIPVIVRTRDDRHLQDLRDAGATEVVPDTFEASIMLASHMLVMLGHETESVLRMTRAARTERYALLQGFYPGTNEAKHDDMQQVDYLEVVDILPQAYAVNKTLLQLKATEHKVIITGHIRGRYRVDNPTPDTIMKSGDKLELQGHYHDIERLQNIIKVGPEV